jgi:hypothetical protein
VLRLPIIFAISGYLCLLLACGLILLPIYFKDISELKQVIFNSLFLLLCLSGLHLIVFQHNHRVYYTEYYFEVQSFSGHLLSQPWEDIVSIKNNNLFGLLFLFNQHNAYSKVSHYLIGYQTFKEFLGTYRFKTE